MRTYFFALGTNHTLSKIDIVNMLARKGIDFEIIEASEEILIISTSSELETKSLINGLGSAVKIGKIFKVCLESEDWERFVLKEIAGQKIGISIYQAGGKYREMDKIFRKIRGKPAFTKAMAGKGRILSSVTVDKKGLLKKGFELVFCVGSKGIYLGKTLSIQDYKGYSFRDYGRPARDARSGMIPPKLAKIMINLAGGEKEDLFLDPFCGRGTILQELVLLGYKNIEGADIEDKAIVDSQKNLEWLFENYKLKKEDFKIDIFKSDARVLSEKIPRKLVDAVVTEPFLGSSQARYLSLDQIKKEIQKLEDLYLAAFKEFKKILKSSGRIVIIFPVFRFKSQFFKLEILEKINELDFKQKYFLGSEVKGKELLKLQITERASVIFFRPGQSVSREIFVFQKI